MNGSAPACANAMRIAVLAIYLLPTAASAAEDCSAELAEFDARLAGKPDDQAKQMVVLMRQSIEQMCPYLDDAALAQYRENLDKYYPAENAAAAKPREERTLAEQLAEKQARQERREKEQRARQERKAAEQAAKPKPSTFAVIDASPTVPPIAGQHLARAEVMQHVMVHDWDLHEGNLRVVYKSHPDRVQFGLPDWTFNVYVVEVTPDGTAAQTLVRSRQESDLASLALRRGHDEVFLIKHIDRPGEPTHFERWSVSSKQQQSSVDMTGFRPATNGFEYGSAQFGVATSDGHAMFSATYVPSRGNGRRIAWFKMSMQGEILGSAELAGIEDTVLLGSWFTSNNGGAGLIIGVQASSDAGLASGEMRSFDKSEFPVSVKPAVMSEKRFLLIGDNGQLAWESVALERTMMFPPSEPAPAIATADDIVARMSGPSEAMQIAARSYRSGRTVNSLNVGPYAHEMIRPMGGGYAALVTQTADREMQPPIHGQYLVVLDQRGVTREIYLNPLALQMDVKFTAFTPGHDSGDFYLLASRAGEHAFVVHMSAEGQPLAYAETSPTTNFDLQRAILISDENGVWLLGDRYRADAGKSLVWIERFIFL